MKNYVINTVLQDDSNYPITLFTANVFHVQENVIGRPMPFHQILLVLDGKGTLHCNGNSYPLKRGCAFYTASHIPVEYINDGGLVSAFVTVTGPCADELSKKLTDNGFLFVESTDLERYLSLIRGIIYDYVTDFNQGSLSSKSYAFFVDFLSQQKTALPDWLNETEKYINMHFNEKLTLTELADRSYISVSKLCSDFKRYFSMTVFEYIMDVRLKHARALLVEFTTLKIKEVAEQCGFSDVGYFCKAYRKKYGKTPSDEKIHQYNTLFT